MKGELGDDFFRKFVAKDLLLILKSGTVIEQMKTEKEQGVTMDLRLMCSLLQATGLHPYYVPIVAVAEAINALTEERTLLRTGFLNLYKEGFFNVGKDI